MYELPLFGGSPAGLELLVANSTTGPAATAGAPDSTATDGEVGDVGKLGETPPVPPINAGAGPEGPESQPRGALNRSRPLRLEAGQKATKLSTARQRAMKAKLHRPRMAALRRIRSSCRIGSRPRSRCPSARGCGPACRRSGSRSPRTRGCGRRPPAAARFSSIARSRAGLPKWIAGAVAVAVAAAAASGGRGPRPRGRRASISLAASSSRSKLHSQGVTGMPAPRP